MIERFDRGNPNHLAAMRKLPFAYMSSEFALVHGAHVIERSGELVIVSQDLVNNHEFPALFLPENEKNWEWLAVTFASDEDVEKLRASGNRVVIENPLSTEYYYKTDEFVNPSGSFKKKVNSFKNKHEHKVLHEYDRDKIEEFYHLWAEQVKERTLTFSESESIFFFLLDRFEEFDVKQVYVEIDGKLAGMGWGIAHHSGGWVGTQLKVDYQYRDLSRFLHHERAKLFADREDLTLGTDVFKEGVKQYKRELHPFEERRYTYVLTGEKE